MRHTSARYFLTLTVLTLVVGCNGGKMPEKQVTFTALKDVPESTWKTLSKKKMFFDHRSVGNNIMAGVADVMQQDPQIKLNIVETSDLAAFDSPLFAHAKNGENNNPQSKIKAFASTMDNGIGNKANIAFFKFCFVDIMADTPIQTVFTDYENTMSQLKIKYPKTMFVHVTVPLTVTRTTIKTWIKKLIWKKEIWELDHNVRKNEFNDLLQSEYAGKEPVFDLASIQSTFPDGRRSTFKRNGRSYYSLVPDYTHDGGHLDEFGRKKVAEQLLILLANLN